MVEEVACRNGHRKVITAVGGGASRSTRTHSAHHHSASSTAAMIMPAARSTGSAKPARAFLGWSKAECLRKAQIHGELTRPSAGVAADERLPGGGVGIEHAVGSLYEVRPRCRCTKRKESGPGDTK